MNDTELLEWAKTVEPPQPVIRGRWAHLLAAFEELRGRGFSCSQAIQALKDRGEIPSGEDLRAMNSLIKLSSRKRRS